MTTGGVMSHGYACVCAVTRGLDHAHYYRPRIYILDVIRKRMTVTDLKQAGITACMTRHPFSGRR